MTTVFGSIKQLVNIAMVTSIAFIFFSVHLSFYALLLVIWDYPVCIPFKRVKQLSTSEGFESVCPSTWNLDCLWSSHRSALSDIDKVSLFYNTFRDIGRVIYSEHAGDGWAKDLEYFEEENKGNI